MLIAIAESPRIPRAARFPFLAPFQKVGRVFWAPEALFQTIRRQPDWVTPFLVVSIVSLLLSLAAEPFATRAAWQAIPAETPVEQIELLQRQIAFGQKVGAILTPALLLVKALLGALLLTLLMIAWTGQGDYRRAFSTINYLSVPLTLAGLGNLLVLRLRGLEQIGGFQDLQARFGLNLFFPATHPALDAFLGALNPFDLWQVILLAIAVRCIAPCARKTAICVATSYWLLGAALQVGVAFLWQAGS
ncbi:MAG: YIP1 family protein [Blastocatellia bacterium]|nr:YIP1 family protein [Blastocatellia bacterium]